MLFFFLVLNLDIFLVRAVGGAFLFLGARGYRDRPGDFGILGWEGGGGGATTTTTLYYIIIEGSYN